VLKHVSRFVLTGWILFAAVLLTAAVIGCSEPAAAPPPDAPWLDPKQQIELLNQNDHRLRILAARNLGNLGAQAAEAIPHLEKMAADPDPKLSQNAREALEKIRAASDQPTGKSGN
jgi:hypothetical protein